MPTTAPAMTHLAAEESMSPTRTKPVGISRVGMANLSSTTSQVLNRVCVHVAGVTHTPFSCTKHTCVAHPYRIVGVWMDNGVAWPPCKEGLNEAANVCSMASKRRH